MIIGKWSEKGHPELELDELAGSHLDLRPRSAPSLSNRGTTLL
jgi:hypothetical protein